jgi:hypothetical protein
MPQDVEVFAEFADIARARVSFVSVNVVCDEWENSERATDAGWGKGKLTDGQALMEMRTKHRLLDASVLKEETG